MRPHSNDLFVCVFAFLAYSLACRHQARNLNTGTDVDVLNNAAPVVGTSADTTVPQGTDDDGDDDDNDKGAESAINLFAFTFNDANQPSQLLWDPEIGIAADASGTYTPAASAAPTARAVGAAFGAVFVALVAGVLA